jgi:hypothetical protein
MRRTALRHDIAGAALAAAALGGNAQFGCHFRNGFKGGAAEAAARGKCGHKKYLVQVVKNRYRNYNGGKAAFPAKIAAKSAQNVQKSGQNA